MDTRFHGYLSLMVSPPYPHPQIQPATDCVELYSFMGKKIHTDMDLHGSNLCCLRVNSIGRHRFKILK